jgi:hypothetical protein
MADRNGTIILLAIVGGFAALLIYLNRAQIQSLLEPAAATITPSTPEPSTQQPVIRWAPETKPKVRIVADWSGNVRALPALDYTGTRPGGIAQSGTSWQVAHAASGR